MTSTVIVAGARTPMGRFNGALASVSATDLGGIAIRGALERAGVPASDVQYVIMGEVLQAGVGQIPARQAAVAGGIAMDVPAVTINKVCLSGLDAIALADQLIRAGEFDIVVAGGMESMTRAPHLLQNSRAGFKYGDVTMVDHLAHDGLHDVFTDVPMGQLTETTNDLAPVTRLEQDAFAARSHQRAAAATANGVFKAEIEPVVISGRKGDVVVDSDEGIRPDTTVESLGKLRPAFRKDGTITAGSASQISDGAAAVVVMSRAEAERRGLEWIAEITAHGMIAGPDSSLQDKPARAIRAGLRQGRYRAHRSGSGRDQRGLRRGRHRLHPRPGYRRGDRQRQRWGDCDGPPHRRVRRPHRAAPGAGVAAPRRRCRGRHALRRWRTGRCPGADGPQPALISLVSSADGRRWTPSRVGRRPSASFGCLVPLRRCCGRPTARATICCQARPLIDCTTCSSRASAPTSTRGVPGPRHARSVRRPAPGWSWPASPRTGRRCPPGRRRRSRCRSGRSR